VSTILIIDDEPGIRTVLRDVLEDEGYTVLAVEDGIMGLAELAATTVDLVFLDVWLPHMGGMDVLKRIREQFPYMEVIMISGHANISLAVQATKMGAFDFLEKPLSLDRTMTVVRNALAIEDLRRENRTLRNSLFMDDRMVGDSTGMRAVRELIAQSAASDSRILIMGENGTGKELVAREIHARSARAAGPFVELNCAAIPENLIESELFGHEKGAFTNALQRRRGKVETADHGTLFLDEIADMSTITQAKVLRVLQEMRFERVGGEESISVDVRVISATNKDIPAEIAQGRFREDLFFRINVVPIHVPPLRERLDDLALLVGYFMEKFKRPSAQEPRTVSPEGMKVLCGYHWPGNIRELKNFVERVNIMTEEAVPGCFRPGGGEQHALRLRWDDALRCA
jgi:two-component system nitrogen regulation response regulator NtrX